jgi:MFS family permease
MPTWLERFLPTNPIARRLSYQSILFAVGQGAFLTGSAVFFTHIVGLTASQVGLGLTIAGLVSFLFAVPLGKFADRVGTKRLWAVTSFIDAGLFLVWPWLEGFAQFLAMVVVLETVGTAGYTAFGAYTLNVFSREERVRSQAFMRSALNIGFTFGALIGGLALATNSDAVIRWMPVLPAMILALNAFLITRLPDAQGEVEASSDIEALVGSPPQPGQAKPPQQPKQPSVLRNRGYLAMSLFDGVLGTNQVLLNVVIPLWLVQETDAPRVLLAWLFGTNTVLAVLLQVPASRGSETVTGALRAARISTGFMVLSCFVVMVTSDTLGWTTILLVWLGHVTVTGAELFQSAGHWGLTSELSEPARRAEYQGAGHVGGTLGSVWAPALFTFLAMEWGSTGWLVIAGIVVVAGIGIHPAAHAAERHLATRTTRTADQPA